ncbi:MAG: hypothetical protein JWL59_4839 [Chthoniobacteraceae bacterium]|nr:hypothetical protein [Chthoniobacteraceae bacterium]
MPPFAVDEDAGVLGEGAEEVGLDLVFFLLGEVAGEFAGSVSPRLLDDLGFAEEIGAVDGAFLVSCPEDEAVAEVQGEDAGFFFTERRNERGGGLGGGDDGGTGLADDVDAVVVAHAFLGRGDETLGFVGPQDEQVVALALFCGFVEAA